MSKRKTILLALVFFILISFMCKSYCGVVGNINSDVLNISIINITDIIHRTAKIKRKPRINDRFSQPHTSRC